MAAEGDARGAGVIVADASLIIYRHVAGPLTPLAGAARAKDPDWRTAPVWRFEMTSALVKMIRGGVLDEAGALAALAAADAEMTGREVDVPQDRALRDALRYGTSAYDAQYVVVADLLGAPCVTADAALAKKTPGLSTLLADFVQ
jgi:predicted nucleic acid-binding protein